MILILMGVSGIGKTTIGQLLSTRTGWSFEDADDYHPQANRQKMAAGIPLNDDDRRPWLEALHTRMMQYRDRGADLILACSALKQQYRDLLAQGFAPTELRFIYLNAPADLIAARLHVRHHQYMNPHLLDSQIATLEEPKNAWPISVAGTPEDAVQQILARLSNTPSEKP